MYPLKSAVSFFLQNTWTKYGFLCGFKITSFEYLIKTSNNSIVNDSQKLQNSLCHDITKCKRKRRDSENPIIL